MKEVQDEKEIARIKRLQVQMREREKRKFANPDAEPELEWIWVAHVWIPNNPKDVSIGEWVFAGFRRHRNRRKPQSMNGFFSKVRRKFGIHKASPVVMRDLQSTVRLIRGKDQAWRTRPPQFQKRLKPPMDVKPGPQPIGETTKRRAPKRAYRMNKKTTTFIALGRNPWDRKAGHVYCGPLEAVYKSDAVREADRLFRNYNDILVVKVADLSKPLANRMHSGKRVRAGVTRIVWPEPVPEFRLLWEQLERRGKVDAVDSEQYDTVHKTWEEANFPWLSLGWLRKAIRKLTPSTGDKQCKPKRKGKGKATTRSLQKKSCVLPPSVSRKRRRPAAMRARFPHRIHSSR